MNLKTNARQSHCVNDDIGLALMLHALHDHAGAASMLCAVAMRAGPPGDNDTAAHAWRPRLETQPKPTLRDKHDWRVHGACVGSCVGSCVCVCVRVQT